MKKLLVIAAVMTMAIGAQAATYNWTWAASNLYNYGGTTTADLISGVDVSLWLIGATEDVCVSTVTSTTTGSVLLDASGFTTTDALTETGIDYKFYLTYTDSNGNYFSSKGIKEVSAAVDELTGSAIKFNSLATITKETAGWTAANVPEPTSGLLLLLGMAGLALRRKRA